jgi:hypothetical protein
MFAGAEVGQQPIAVPSSPGYGGKDDPEMPTAQLTGLDATPEDLIALICDLHEQIEDQAILLAFFSDGNHTCRLGHLCGSLFLSLD